MFPLGWCRGVIGLLRRWVVRFHIGVAVVVGVVGERCWCVVCLWLGLWGLGGVCNGA